jgi:hypothetical protein
MMITVQKHAKIFLTVSVTYHDNAVRIRITDDVGVTLVSINVWRLTGDTLNITCNFLCCNHQVKRDFLITLYI